jgi:hyperosmotically inducible periplasmic protein
MKPVSTKLRFFAPLAVVAALGACSVQQGQESTGEYVDSAAISTEVKTKLASEGGVALAQQVKVETLKDVVQLSGFVRSDTDRAKAEQIAWTVDGVRAVENDIIVQP